MTRKLAMAVALGVAAGAAAAAPSGASGDFSATAAADGLRVGVAVPRFLVVEQFVDTGVPSAQAHVDSLGNSQAWAANPFPGDVVVSAPGTVAGFGPPGLPSLPQYPLMASATYPTQESQEVEGPAYLLRSRAEEQAASALADAGFAAEDVRVGTVRGVADALRETDGTARAMARSTVEAFTVGDALRIGRVESRAVAEVAPGASVARQAETTIAEVTVAGQAVLLDERGLHLPGGEAPLPDADPVRAALAEAGIDVRYLAPEETDSGVVAAGVEVRIVRDVPSVGTGIVTYVLGRASASAAAQADPVAGFPAGTVPAVPDTPAPEAEEEPGEAPAAPEPEPVTAAPGPVAPPPVRAPVTAPGGAVTVPAVSAPVAGSAVDPGPPTAPDEVAAPPVDPPGFSPARPAGVVTAGPDFSGFAPVLAGGGLVVVGALLVTHRLMRSASWTS